MIGPGGVVQDLSRKYHIGEELGGSPIQCVPPLRPISARLELQKTWVLDAAAALGQWMNGRVGIRYPPGAPYGVEDFPLFQFLRSGVVVPAVSASSGGVVSFGQGRAQVVVPLPPCSGCARSGAGRSRAKRHLHGVNEE